jgi:CBS domain-containing protein
MFKILFSECNLVDPYHSATDKEGKPEFYQQLSTNDEKKDENNTSSIKQTEQEAEQKRHVIGINEFQSNATTTTLKYNNLLVESDDVLCWLARYRVEKNHPRFLSTKSQDTSHKLGEVLCVKYSTNLLDCFNNLIINGFSSAPIIDDNNNFINMIDLLDVIFYLLRDFGVWRDEEDIRDKSNHAWAWGKYIQLLFVKHSTVKDAIERPVWAYRQKLHPIKVGYSTLTAIEILVREHVHRITIVNDQEKPVSILTRSMMMSLIEQNMGLLGSIGNIQITKILQDLPKSLITVDEDDILVKAYRLMAQHNLSGLPVTDSNKNLTDCISRRDLRGLGSQDLNKFDRLWKCSVKQYKNIVREEFPTQTPKKLIVITKNENIRDLVTFMNDGNIHRVFVIELDKNSKPVPTHIITQWDLLRFILHQIGLAG